MEEYVAKNLHDVTGYVSENKNLYIATFAGFIQIRMGSNPPQAEQPLQGIEMQAKQALQGIDLKLKDEDRMKSI